MTEVIYLSNINLLIVICVISGLAVWYMHNIKKENRNDSEYKYTDKMVDTLVKTVTKMTNVDNNDTDRRQFLNKRDADVLYNDFKPPERRVPEYTYPYNYVKAQLNIPTRGLPEEYQMLGVLLRDDTESAYNLFGRQTYPGSNMWEYYASGSMHNTEVKLPIQIRGNKEIEDSMIVNIPGTDKKRGEFKVKLYKLDSPRYNPYA